MLDNYEPGVYNMSMTQTHSAMLKRYVKEKIFDTAFAEKSYIWSNVEKKLDWAGGVYEVPIRKNSFSSVQMGSLPAANDIAEASEVMGTIAGHKELCMTAIFNEGDLARHNYSEQTYLEKLPDMIDDLTRVGVEQMEASLFRGGGTISYAIANGAVGGTIAVANPEYFPVFSKVEVIDNDTAAVTGYVISVDINTGSLNIQTARSAGSNIDLSAYTTAQSARVRMVGSGTESFLDFKSALLPLSLGGLDSLYGQTKASIPGLQAKRKDGSAYTASTILKDLLKEYFDNRRLGRGNPSEIWVNYGMFANMAANVEAARQYFVKDKASGYGFSSISLVGNEGDVKIVGLRHLPTDVAIFADWAGIKFAGLPMKKKLYGDAGMEYFTVRNTTGVQFITDICLRGDFVINPAKFGIAYNIPASVST